MNRLTTNWKLDPEIFKNMKDMPKNKYFLKVPEGKTFDDTIELAADKLGRYEDIEEELGGGVELSVLLNNGLKNGVYLKDLRDYEPITFVRAITLGYYKRWILEYDYFIYNVEDYGKTWAFTREELEHEISIR